MEIERNNVTAEEFIKISKNNGWGTKRNYQNQGIGKRLMMEVIKEYGHTNIFLGSQKENEIFFEK